jgi:hypothetical protein
MLMLRHARSMSQTTFPPFTNKPATRPSAPETCASANGSAWVPPSDPVPGEVIDNLAVYIAGRDERRSIDELATRAGARRPDGALMVAALDGQPLAAGSISDGEVVSEPSASGAAAAAIVRYRLASLRRQRS